MSTIPDDRRYSETHEWCRVQGNIATLGITKHAAETLTDLVCLEFSVGVGDDVARDEEFGVVDSVKASEPLVSPISGRVTELNTEFENENKLILIGESPYDRGWLIKVELQNPKELDGLMTAAQYADYLHHEG